MLEISSTSESSVRVCRSSGSELLEVSLEVSLAALGDDGKSSALDDDWAETRGSSSAFILLDSGVVLSE